jgi:hypothetical protein
MTPPPEASALDRLRSPKGLRRSLVADLKRLADKWRAETVSAPLKTRPDGVCSGARLPKSPGRRAGAPNAAVIRRMSNDVGARRAARAPDGGLARAIGRERA